MNEEELMKNESVGETKEKLRNLLLRQVQFLLPELEIQVPALSVPAAG